MAKTLKLQVTEDDIRLGKRGDPCNCPVARALKRQTRLPVHVDAAGAVRLGKAGPLLYSPSVRTERFVDAFDVFGRDSVKPLTLSLKPMAQK